MSSTTDQDYYVPHGTHWPIIGSVGLSLTVIGTANFLHGTWSATPIFVGIAIIIFMMYGWFGTVVTESLIPSGDWSSGSKAIFSETSRASAKGGSAGVSPERLAPA